jgi:hypothetical protein
MDEVRLYLTTGRVLRLFRIECIARSARHVAVVSGFGPAGDGAGFFDGVAELTW